MAFAALLTVYKNKTIRLEFEIYHTLNKYNYYLKANYSKMTETRG